MSGLKINISKTIWNSGDFGRGTKVKVYQAAVLPCLLYVTEGVTLYRKHIKAVTRLQLKLCKGAVTWLLKLLLFIRRPFSKI